MPPPPAPSIEQRSPRVVAAFDFDGTLTTRDTFARVIGWRLARWRFIQHWLATSPLLAKYALGIVSNDAHKMALFNRRFGGWTLPEFERHSSDFAAVRIPQLLRPAAVEKLKVHLRWGHTVVVVTASFPHWIDPWAQSAGVSKVLGSHLEIEKNQLTGRMAGPNCYGPEKLRRLLAAFPDRDQYTLVAYGDSRGDRELLAAADEAFFRRF